MSVSHNETTKPQGWRIWWLAARPRTLPAAIVPVLVGSAIAIRNGQFQLLPFLAAFLASLLIQIGTNYANDLFDHLKGADHQRQGPTRAVQSGLVTPSQMRNAVILVFGVAALLGLSLIYVGGWPIAVIGALSILAGIAYTGGPYPLAYHGLGDLFAFLFFGVIAVTGTAYIFTHEFTGLALIASLPVALLVTAIIVVNNLRDIPTDTAVGKRTFAVMLGDRRTRYEYTLCLLGAYLFPIGLAALAGSIGWWWLPFLTLPLAFQLVRTVLHGQAGPALNKTLGQTAQLHLWFGIALSLSILLS
ncbi:1,4-dihydroxy-2-naphthoate octaprenyltransferase [Thermoflexales bacterium]|nr:1,4-dihydroxy-2-naphthoate octaprenyltransferase [Thermoflexales bacterium]